MRFMKTKNIHPLLFMVTALCYSQSCNEERFLDRFPLGAPNASNFFVDAKSAKVANNAAYYAWTHSIRTHLRDMDIVFDAMTDDAAWDPFTAYNIQKARWDITPDNNAIVGLWQQIFQSVNAANFAIQGIPTSSDPAFTEELQKPYLAEARFMRAYNYLFMVPLWGDLPLLTKPLTSEEEFFQPRVSREEVYQLIIEDLTYAKENLPSSWPGEYKGSATRAAAAAFLTKAYVFMEDYQNAIASGLEAVSIAEQDGYYLLDDYGAIFEEANEGNPELLFYFGFLSHPDYGTNATVMRKSRLLPADIVTVNGVGWTGPTVQRDLYDAYEPGDPRRAYTMYAPGDFYGIYNGPNTFTINYTRYDDVTGVKTEYSKTYSAGDSVEYSADWDRTGIGYRKLTKDVSTLERVDRDGLDFPVLRVADLYLLIAEAYAEQGNPEALVWVNKVRARPSVDMPPKILADGDLVDIVRHERRIELALEGRRIFDIMRWKNLAEIFPNGATVKAHVYSDYLSPESELRFDAPIFDLPKHYLWPIPQMELDINSKMSQNPGY